MADKMAHHIPTTAFILTLIGGVFVLLGGVVLAWLGSIFLSFGIAAGGLLFVGLGVGLLIIIMAILMWVAPGMKLVWGILTIVLSLVSWPFALGGFFIGFLLALLGGIFAITYKSQPMMAAPMMPPPMPPMAPPAAPPPPMQ
jgi:hypothetical protein